MVSSNRLTDTPRRESTIRSGLINRREILRRRRGRPTVARRLFTEINEHLEELGRSINDDGSDLPELANTRPPTPFGATSSLQHSFERINQEALTPLNHINETLREYSSGDSDSFSTASTVIIDLNNDSLAGEYLYRQWENRAIIRTNVNVQTSSIYSPSALSGFDYPSPSYSPVNLSDIEDLDHANSTEPLFSDNETVDLIADAEVNRLLDYIEEKYYLVNEP